MQHLGQHISDSEAVLNQAILDREFATNSTNQNNPGRLDLHPNRVRATVLCFAIVLVISLPRFLIANIPVFSHPYLLRNRAEPGEFPLV